MPSATSTGVMAERAGLSAGQHVLEIGTGWGGFALYAAGELGCRVTTVTISKAQHDARDGARPGRRPARTRSTVLLRDYREIEGQYDAIVSIEMFEAVGAEYFETYFAACDRALRPGGRLSMQTIAFPDVSVRAAGPRRELDPDIHLPGRPAARHSPRSSEPCMARAPRPERARTSRRTTSGRSPRGEPRSWPASMSVRAMGFDERFIRMWEYYLAISEAGFDTGVCQDYQIVLEKGRAIPSRELVAQHA